MKKRTVIKRNFFSKLFSKDERNFSRNSASDPELYKRVTATEALLILSDPTRMVDEIQSEEGLALMKWIESVETMLFELKKEHCLLISDVESSLLDNDLDLTQRVVELERLFLNSQPTSNVEDTLCINQSRSFRTYKRKSNIKNLVKR